MACTKRTVPTVLPRAWLDICKGLRGFLTDYCIYIVITSKKVVLLQAKSLQSLLSLVSDAGLKNLVHYVRLKDMNKCLILVAAAMMTATSLQAQTERSDDFKAKYELKEVVVMSRHNIRSPLTRRNTSLPVSCLLPTWRFNISTTRTSWTLCSRPSSRR